MHAQKRTDRPSDVRFISVLGGVRGVSSLSSLHGEDALRLNATVPLVSTKCNELIHRLLAGRCEICESTDRIEVHHLRKLADLNRHDLWVPNWSSTSCDLGVFVYQPVE